jgi:hypothetical protein
MVQPIYSSTAIWLIKTDNLLEKATVSLAVYDQLENAEVSSINVDWSD